MCCFQTSHCGVGSCLSECMCRVMEESDVQWLGGEKWEERGGKERGEEGVNHQYALVTETAILVE